MLSLFVERVLTNVKNKHNHVLKGRRFATPLCTKRASIGSQIYFVTLSINRNVSLSLFVLESSQEERMANCITWCSITWPVFSNLFHAYGALMSNQRRRVTWCNFPLSLYEAIEILLKTVNPNLLSCLFSNFISHPIASPKTFRNFFVWITLGCIQNLPHLTNTQIFWTHP